VHDFFESDVMSVTPGEPFLARVEIFPVAHPFRAGSKIRITIDTPGGNRGEWKFATLNAGEKVTILHDAEHSSSIALSIVPGLKVPPGVAACGSLRGQPCRAN
jgi:predicted acyl esterase